jgi:hypothetical protein
MGAAGRDFHNFNVYFRGNKAYDVVAFTATQIPNIEGRIYPPELAGPGYPQGIPIYSEDQLARLISDLNVDQVVFGYSDISYEDVMHRASIVLAAGADFRLMGGHTTNCAGGRGGFPLYGWTYHHAEVHRSHRISLCRAHRLRQEPDQPASGRHLAGDGQEGNRHPSSHALWRPGETGGAAFCPIR